MHHSNKMILSRTDLDILERNRSYSLLTNEDVAKGKSTNWPELEISGGLRNLSPSVWKLTHLTALYLNDNCIKILPPAISLLIHLRRLDLANNKLRSLPPEIGDLTEMRELTLANNLLRTLPFELGKCFQLTYLCLKGNQLGPEFTTRFNQHQPHGLRELLDFMLDSMNLSLPLPPPRLYIPVAQIDRSRPTANFSVMCYNVLCDRYATRQMYGYCPQWALSWEYRKKGILDEIKAYHADIVTLQEVEMEQFYNYFLRELKRDGYEGIFSPKSRAKTMTDTERKRVDGCAIFYKTSKFTLVKEHLIEFNQLAMSLTQSQPGNGADSNGPTGGGSSGMNVQSNRNLLNRVMPKDNIALAALLETKESVWDTSCPMPSETRQQLLVCTAHIHWDPEFCDVKLIQTMMLIDQLKRLIAEYSAKPSLHNNPIQLLLCGDLNSLPESGVVEFLSQGRISTSHADFKNFDYLTTLIKMLNHTPNKDYYTHAFKLASAVSTEVMPYTNFTYEFKGMIDYIFYPKRSMRPVGILGPLDENYLKDNKVVGCPQAHMPSDHFSLYVDLALPLPLGSAEDHPLPASNSISAGPLSPHMGGGAMAGGGAAAAAVQMNNNIGMFGGAVGLAPNGPPPIGGPPPPTSSGASPFSMPQLMNYPPPTNKNNNLGFGGLR